MNDNRDEITSYKSFWLRCWQAGRRGTGEEPDWCFSLEDPVEGKKKGFTDLDQLLAYLRREIEHVD